MTVSSPIAILGTITVLLLLLLLSAALTISAETPLWTPLDEYVWNTPNPVYSWSVVSTGEVGDVSVAVLNMTSQVYLSPDVVDRHVWYHYMVVAVPNGKKRKENMMVNRAFMHIGGSSNRPASPPSPNDPNNIAVLTAQHVGCVSAALYQIPNQPLLFKNDTVPPGEYRTEDAIIAWTWDRYMRSGGRDPYILARMPMVKATVLAMDTVEAFVKAQYNVDSIANWAVAGESKRGWTAWLTAAVDYKRVDTVVPIVIDIVDTIDVLRRIRASICGWPEAMKDYVVQGVTDKLDSDEFRMMMQILDPLAYNERFEHIEKYIVNAGNDQFFWPDGSTFGYHKLQGSKSLRYVPNTGHYLAESDAIPATLSYLYARMHDMPLPRYSFNQTFVNGGMLINAWLESPAIRPSSVSLWTITNPKARDFRLELVGKAWISKDLSTKETTWSVFVPDPPSGYTAAMIEFVFSLPGSGQSYLKFTTSAYITPNTTPCS